MITQLRTRWDGPIDAPRALPRQGPAERALAGAPRRRREADAIGRPGICATPTLQLEASEAAARRASTCTPVALDLPGVFDERGVPLDRLDAQADLEDRARRQRRRADGSASGSPSATFANADAQGRAERELAHGRRQRASARGGRYPGQLELDGQLIDGVAARTARYLPLGLPEGVRSYVAGAVRDGTIASATFRVRGDLWDFPFHDVKAARDGEFRIAAKFEGRDLRLYPGRAGARPTHPARRASRGRR